MLDRQFSAHNVHTSKTIPVLVWIYTAFNFNHYTHLLPSKFTIQAAPFENVPAICAIECPSPRAPNPVVS